MKKIAILPCFLISLCSFAQVYKSTPSNINFIEDFVDTSKVTIISLHGAKERTETNDISDLDKLKELPFYKFYLANKGRYNFFIPQQTTSSYSWIYPVRNDVPYGVEFILWVKKTYGVKKIILTGHSMGSPWSIAAIIPNELSGIAVVSGSGNYEGCVKLGQLNMPVIAWHGEEDATSPNDFASGRKACIAWYQNTGKGKPIWNPLPGVGHDADVYAYAPNSGLKEWIDSLFSPVITPPPVILDSLMMNFLKADKNIIFMFK